MKNLTKRDFWGKYNEADQTWHPLEDHCLDVGVVALLLLQETHLGVNMRAWGEATNPNDLFSEVWKDRLAVLAALHDIGKYNHGFQNKIRGALAPAGHVQEVLVLFGGESFSEYRRRLLQALPTEDLLAWGPDQIAFKLLWASIAHHGGPGTISERPAKFDVRDLWTPNKDRCPWTGIENLVARLRKVFPKAWDRTAPPLPSNPEFQHAFAGLVTMADWIGSHTYTFPYTPDPPAQHRFEELEDGDLSHWRAGMDILGVRPHFFRNFLKSGRFPLLPMNRQPTGPQQGIYQTQVYPDGGSVTILEAETGSGKTEAAFIHFLRLYWDGLVDGMYFALPTRAAALQIYTRIQRMVIDVWKDRHPPVTLAVPGYQTNTNWQDILPSEDKLWNDDPVERARSLGWASENSKRFLCGTVVVGTVDQVLLSTLQVPHSHLRAAAMARLLVVVDEVHQSDAYMANLLEEALRFHIKGNGHCLLMSATLGVTTATRFLNLIGQSNPSPSLEESKTRPFPALQSKSQDSVQVFSARETQPTRQVFPVVENAEDIEHLVETALTAATVGGRVLIIRNTVRDCLETQQALEKVAPKELLFKLGKNPVPFHSRFCKQDRRLIEDHVMDEFGDDSFKFLDARGVILVATQVAEQSLDLDADVLITDLCPMDVLIQRMGRLHRHPRRTRPIGCHVPYVHLLAPSEPDLSKYISKSGMGRGPHGVGTVYQDLRILWKTLVLAHETAWTFPGDERMLVELCTHPEALAELHGEAWERHARWLNEHVQRSGQASKVFTTPRTTHFGNFKFPPRSVTQEISARLGSEDRMVVFTKEVASPFRKTMSEVLIPSHLVRGRTSLDPVEAIQDSEGVILFRYGEVSFRYDRLGLRQDSP